MAECLPLQLRGVAGHRHLFLYGDATVDSARIGKDHRLTWAFEKRGNLLPYCPAPSTAYTITGSAQGSQTKRR